MTDVTYVVANAPTLIQIPLTAFESVDEARTFLEGLGLRGGVSGSGSDEYASVDFDGAEYALKDVLGLVIDREEDQQTALSEHALKMVNALFKNGHYYDGQGAVESVTLVTRALGEPVVEFDLG